MVDVEDMSIESLEKHLERMKKERDESTRDMVYETYTRKIVVDGNGYIHITDLGAGYNKCILVSVSLPELYDAIELSKKRRGKI